MCYSLGTAACHRSRSLGAMRGGCQFAGWVRYCGRSMHYIINFRQSCADIKTVVKLYACYPASNEVFFRPLYRRAKSNFSILHSLHLEKHKFRKFRSFATKFCVKISSLCWSIWIVFTQRRKICFNYFTSLRGFSLIQRKTLNYCTLLISARQ